MVKIEFKPAAVVRSLNYALQNPVDITISLQRVRGMLSHLPEESLIVKHDRNHVNFYEYKPHDNTSCDKHQMVYLRKTSGRLYLLARKRYLQELLTMLNTTASFPCESAEWSHRFDKFATLIDNYATGNLNIARIVLTSKQYSWLTRKYRQKVFKPEPDSDPLTTIWGVPVLSKSEQNVGNALIDFAAPNHYEEMLSINVQNLVKTMELNLQKSGKLTRNLFYYRNGTCYWNVPSEYAGMNAPGSLWHTYNSRTGYISIHPDFTIMLVDGTLVYWEHEGLFHDYLYRTNALERVGIMLFSGGISPENIIETIELESNNRTVLEEIIKKRIVPRLWF